MTGSYALLLFCPGWIESHLSPFGVIPKKGGNKWRVIVDLSSLHGTSINDGINPALTSIHYSSRVGLSNP